MSSIHAGGASGIPEKAVPLPPRPNLEFERKRARQILRAVHGRDDEMLARVRRYRNARDASSVKLSDVQLMIARDYGFKSWPKLVSYHETLARHERSAPEAHTRQMWDHHVRMIIHGHARGLASAIIPLATFVPRFYGRSDEEIRNARLTEADARLAAARLERFPGWDAIVVQPDEPIEQNIPTVAQRRKLRETRLGIPFADAWDAIHGKDLETLSHVIDEHPEVLAIRGQDNPHNSVLLLMRAALQLELDNPGSDVRVVSDFLVSRGADLDDALNQMMLTGIKVRPEYIRFLLDRGADPNWILPNGLSILEWAILRYWSPGAVDVIAEKAKRRSAFWIAAGLGDVDEMLRYLSSDGKPSDAARRDRPDFILARFPMPCRPDAEDLEILWEAFCVAGFNQRLDAIDALLDRGFPIDYAPWGSTLLKWAEGNHVTVLAEHLLMRGAKA